MDLFKKVNLKDFLKDNPHMSIKPSKKDGLVLEGNFSFKTKFQNFPEVDETYNLRIYISNKFPHVIPEVLELKDKIPKISDYHINPGDTFCLGSPIKLLTLINKKPTLNGFAEYCLVPFLYAISLKIKYDYDLIFGELAHGTDGIIGEYIQIFEVDNKETVENIINMLSLNKRVANKLACPCQCGNRLGKCKLRLTVNKYRKLAPRSWYQEHLLTID